MLIKLLVFCKRHRNKPEIKLRSTGWLENYFFSSREIDWAVLSLVTISLISLYPEKLGRKLCRTKKTFSFFIKKNYLKRLRSIYFQKSLIIKIISWTWHIFLSTKNIKKSSVLSNYLKLNNTPIEAKQNFYY